MEETYNHIEVEKRIRQTWKTENRFSPAIQENKKPFSLFLVPPNASGPLHIGNAFMVAIQDILARYHRTKGTPTLWIPSTDHGGYETQVSFERELEKAGKHRSDFSRKELFHEIQQFVEKNNSLIKEQLQALGASVDWNRFRFTMDEQSVLSVNHVFKKMAEDGLIYRELYMVNFCPVCSTFLADIELKEAQEQTPLYRVNFQVQNEADYITLATSRPEFLFSITHALVHPSDAQHASYIGKTLINPITGKPVTVVASKRKFDPAHAGAALSVFAPCYKSYDYQYALRGDLPYRNLLDWQGKLIERYPGLTPVEARKKEAFLLEQSDSLESVDPAHQETKLLCKKGHVTESLIVYTWFLRLDDEKHPLRAPALAAVEKDQLPVFPQWRKKGLVEWISKMADWPIARQNVWGIKIPLWYDISNPDPYIVWFTDKQGKRQQGNLKDILQAGTSLDEITAGLERLYAGEHAVWSLKREEGKTYLPETDTFDTWFSSGQWAHSVFGDPSSADFSYFYPSDSIIIGQDLLRLSVARKILLSVYVTHQLPFKRVYLHSLIKGADGQKMSKSMGNTTSLENYLETFGADVIRMTLTSYAGSPEDFYVAPERLLSFQDFSKRLWDAAKAIQTNSTTGKEELLPQVEQLAQTTGQYIERYMFAAAQESVCNFLTEIEKQGTNEVFEKYIAVLHPFMPFMTEEISRELGKKNSPELLA